MDIGGEKYRALGGVHAVPVAEVEGTLILCGLDAIGADPGELLATVEGNTVVCLQTDEELIRRFPAYVEWLAMPALWSCRPIRTTFPNLLYGGTLPCQSRGGRSFETRRRRSIPS